MTKEGGQEHFEEHFDKVKAAMADLIEAQIDAHSDDLEAVLDGEGQVSVSIALRVVSGDHGALLESSFGYVKERVNEDKRQWMVPAHLVVRVFAIPVLPGVDDVVRSELSAQVPRPKNVRAVRT